MNIIEKLKMKIEDGSMREDIRWESFSDVFIREIENASLVVDCGAEFGFYINLIKRFGAPDCRVIGYEPDPERFELLKAFFATDDNVKIYPYALSNTNSNINIYKSVKSCAKSATIDKNMSQIKDSGDSVAIAVEARTLDNLQETEKPDIIKMDIEGAEVYALDGARKILLESRPLIFLEYHPQYVEAIEPLGKGIILKLLKDLDYKTFNNKGALCDLAAGRVILSPSEKASAIRFDPIT